jgi:type VI protein secretion system component VasK
MTIDGQAAEFTQANQAPKQFSWPGTGHGVQAQLSYRGLTSPFPPYDGLWGIFQFVQDADVRQGARVDRFLKSGKGENRVRDPVTNQPITLTFDITASPPVFEKGYFAGLACVAEVAK